MKKTVRRRRSTLLLILVFLELTSGCSERKIHRIGIPDGTAGLITRYVLEEKLKSHSIESVAFEPYTLYDCCAAATRYALGSARLDMAVMCPDAGRILVSKNPRYKIVGAVMFNSDVIITRSGDFPKAPTIAVSQKRTYQRRMVKRIFGADSRPIPMLHTAVPFAFEKGVVQGAALDIAKAFSLKGVFHRTVKNQRAICTYVLVCKKSLQNEENFQRFMEAYARALEEMGSNENLLKLLRRYLSENLTQKEVKQWRMMKVQFANPLKHRLQG